VNEPEQQLEGGGSEKGLPSLWLVLAMPVSLAVTALALMLGLLVAIGLDEGSEAAPASPAATQPSSSETGVDVFAGAGCGGCHTLAAADATGTVGPSLDQTQLTTDQIAEVVANGRGTGMPAFSGQLDEDEIAAVAAYVSESKSG
jgi:mono/diheme cytochrome c family protein